MLLSNVSGFSSGMIRSSVSVSSKKAIVQKKRHVTISLWTICNSQFVFILNWISTCLFLTKIFFSCNCFSFYTIEQNTTLGLNKNNVTCVSPYVTWHEYANDKSTTLTDFKIVLTIIIELSSFMSWAQLRNIYQNNMLCKLQVPTALKYAKEQGFTIIAIGDN